jgi:hypothetical protein
MLGTFSSSMTLCTPSGAAIPACAHHHTRHLFAKQRWAVSRSQLWHGCISFNSSSDWGCEDDSQQCSAFRGSGVGTTSNVLHWGHLGQVCAQQCAPWRQILWEHVLGGAGHSDHVFSGMRYRMPCYESQCMFKSHKTCVPLHVACCAAMQL